MATGSMAGKGIAKIGICAALLHTGEPVWPTRIAMVGLYRHPSRRRQAQAGGQKRRTLRSARWWRRHTGTKRRRMSTGWPAIVKTRDDRIGRHHDRIVIGNRRR